eukprot:g18076.t1
MPFVGDFGVAAHHTTAEVAPCIVGSIHYLSPELCDGGRSTAAADCWALGVILYEMCALELPFPGNNALAVTMKIMHGVVQPLSTSYSVELRSLCSALLCPSVKHRISAKEVSMLPWVRQIQRHDEKAVQEDIRASMLTESGSREFERFIIAQLVSAIAEKVQGLCKAIDKASSNLNRSFPALIRCCGALAVLAPEGEVAPLDLLRKALRKVSSLRPEDFALLKGLTKGEVTLSGCRAKRH